MSAAAFPFVLLATLFAEGSQDGVVAHRPNVVIVMTDDQGYGDFGFQGSTQVRTPNLDAMAARSARMETFYVSPVCAPTRAALLTGRWCQRTRAIDTYIGRAMMEPDEVTLAEALGAAGYATGIFGKWHLGDCYPMRPIDQGFDEALVHRGGGIGQPSDPLGAEGKYTDAVLFHNGKDVATKGYCTDVYFDAALEWMRARSEADEPFFGYVATNAPHGPFHDVPEELYREYLERLGDVEDADKLARIFAMIENVDRNVGRLFAGLEEMGELGNTLVLFLVDNGPNTRRFVGEMRGKKGEVYDGGVRSPFLAHWPARLAAGNSSDRVAAHVDVLPTILEACGVAPPRVDLDGRSLLPLLEGREVDWPDRTLVVQAHRGDEAVRYHHFLARNQRWKLLNASGFGREVESVEPDFELYDMVNDPLERTNLAAERPDVAAELRAAYDAWFDDVCATRRDNFAPPRIHLGAPAAPEVVLTRQDWRRGTWGSRSIGHWEVEVVGEGPFDVRVRALADVDVQRATLRCGDASWSLEPGGGNDFAFTRVRLPLGPARFEIELSDAEGTFGAYQVFVGPARAPNVVIVFTDDQGYGDVGVQGARGFATPNLDRLAAEGARFTDFYVAQPVCSASRAALLTGCYPNRLGIAGALGPKAKHGIHADETTLAEVCRSRGYATAVFGKWHLGHHAEFLPTRHGFDEYYGLPYSNDMWPFHPEWPEGYPPLPTIEGERVVGTNLDQNLLTGEIARRAVDFIERQAKEEKPFFLYVAHPMPHVPLHAGAEFRGGSEAGLYGDVIEEIDASVGNILDALERNGLDEDTLVIFSSDNGPWLSYGDHAGSSGPLREGKGTTFEGGVRVPFLARWPGRIPAGRICAEPAMTIDLLPTIVRLLGAEPPERKIDGLDVWPLLAGEPGAVSPHEAFFFYYHKNDLEAVRSGRWKLHFPHGYRTMKGREPGAGGTPGKYDHDVKTGLELYDLRADVGETRDVAADHPAVVARLTALADAMRQDLGDNLTSTEPGGARPPGRVE